MKTRKKYRSLLLTLLLCLSLTACGSPDGDIAGGDWRTTGVVDAYGTVARDGEEIDVCACLGHKALYFYYNNEKHKLFDTAVLPTDELGDIVWEWEKNAGYLYRPSDSYFRESRVVDEPPADDSLTEQT